MTEIQIGTQIALLRKKRKITQADLANSLSVSNQAVSKWELGICYPDLSLLPKLAEYFDVSTDFLLGISKDLVPEDIMLRLDGDLKLSELLDDAKILDKRGIDCFHKASTICNTIFAEGEQERPPEYYLAHEQYILMYTRIGQGARCVKEYQKRLELEPENWWSYYLLSLALYKNKQEKDSWKWIQRAFQKNYEKPELLLLAGDVCKELKLYEEALVYWKKAYKLDSNNCTALYSQAYLYEKIKDYKNAMRMWSRVIEWRHEHAQDEQHELDWPFVKMAQLKQALDHEATKLEMQTPE